MNTSRGKRIRKAQADEQPKWRRQGVDRGVHWHEQTGVAFPHNSEPGGVVLVDQTKQIHSSKLTVRTRETPLIPERWEVLKVFRTNCTVRTDGKAQLKGFFPNNGNHLVSQLK